jgi:hypothetical protein
MSTEKNECNCGCPFCGGPPKPEHPKGSSGEAIDALKIVPFHDARKLVATIIGTEIARLRLELVRSEQNARYAATYPSSPSVFRLATPGYETDQQIRQLERMQRWMT